MSEEATLEATSREVKGTGNAGRLRRSGITPAIVYGQGEAAEMIQISSHEIEQLLRTHSSSSLLVNIKREGKPASRVLLKDVQYHPVSGKVIHVDFNAVDLTSTVKVHVSLELIGESAGVNEGGVLEQLIREVEIECLPTEIPESISVDISEMNIGDSLHVEQLDLTDVKGTVLTAGDVSIVNVAAPRVVEEVEEEEAAEGAEGTEEGASTEPEVITEKKEETSEE